MSGFMTVDFRSCEFRQGLPYKLRNLSAHNDPLAHARRTAAWLASSPGFQIPNSGWGVTDCDYISCFSLSTEPRFHERIVL